MNTTDSYKALVGEYRDRVIFFIRYTVLAVAVVMIALAISLIVGLFGAAKVIRLEAGEELPSAEEISGKSGAVYEYDEREVDITQVGDYDIHIAYGTNRKMKIKVKVRDTEAPKGVVKTLSLHNGSTVMPEPEDFFDEISEVSDYKASFADVPELNGVGSYNISIALEDEYGNKRVYDTALSVIVDTENPKIFCEAGSIIGYVGEGIAYRSAVTVIDNCFGVSFEVDSSGVDITKEGSYTVEIIATDAAGNRVTAIIPVHIYAVQVTEEMLNERIGELARELGMSKNLTKEELCKLIYGYVNDPTASATTANFTYVGHSNDETRSDWRREAWLTLQNGQGDCYSYFALSKAFFEYFGIENMDIERTKGLTSDTHFWNMVKIEGGWYYFDATRFAGRFTVGGNNGCLMTLEQLKGYKPTNSRYGDSYYAFDEESYPAAATAIINTDYSWN